MLRLKLGQHLPLLFLIAGRFPHLLLALIIHHLLDHTPRLAVQIAQLRVLRCDLGDVNLGRVRHDVRPPLHLIDFVEMDRDLFARGVCAGRLEGPS